MIKLTNTNPAKRDRSGITALTNAELDKVAGGFSGYTQYRGGTIIPSGKYSGSDAGGGANNVFNDNGGASFAGGGGNGPRGGGGT